jgi:protoheme IX farnesyltransferase
VFIGAFPGALPPLIGWVAYTGTFTPQALALFAVQFIWQFPHFWAIAWRLDEDYKKAGFIMLPSGGGKNKQSAFQILFYTLFMVPISLIPMMPEFGLGSVITIIAVLLAGLWMVRPALKLYQTLDDQWATKLMFASFGYLPLILIAMLLDQLFIM